MKNMRRKELKLNLRYAETEMIKYLIIQLDDTSVSYCHYNSNITRRHLISVENLRAGIQWAMKENATVQFVYPSYKLPEEYKTIINTIDHADIVPAVCEDEELLASADVVVFDNINDMKYSKCRKGTVCVLRMCKKEMFDDVRAILPELEKVFRLNLVITDIDSFNDYDFEKYKTVLEHFSSAIGKMYSEGKEVQLNLLTDRLSLNGMNNCNAGWESVALAPDGNFYLCAAFYNDGGDCNVGSVKNGLDIKNQQLYRLDHAPICRRCDAWQCRRCVWLNRKLTLEFNTPSHEQCVLSHLERNASRGLLQELWRLGYFTDTDIKEIDYLDPFALAKN